MNKTNLLFAVVLALTPSMALAETFEAFKATWTTRTAEYAAKSAEDKKDFLNFLSTYIKGLNKAKTLTEEAKLARNFVSEPGIALTDDEIDERIEFMQATQTSAATDWGIEIPETPTQRELGAAT